MLLLFYLFMPPVFVSVFVRSPFVLLGSLLFSIAIMSCSYIIEFLAGKKYFSKITNRQTVNCCLLYRQS